MRGDAQPEEDRAVRQRDVRQLLGALLDEDRREARGDEQRGGDQAEQLAVAGAHLIELSELQLGDQAAHVVARAQAVIEQPILLGGAQQTGRHARDVVVLVQVDPRRAGPTAGRGRRSPCRCRSCRRRRRRGRRASRRCRGRRGRSPRRRWRRGSSRGAAAARSARSSRRRARRPAPCAAGLAARSAASPTGSPAPSAAAGDAAARDRRRPRRRRLPTRRRGVGRVRVAGAPTSSSRNRTTVMLSRPPASLAASTSARPASPRLVGAAEDLARRSSSVIIAVRPSLHSSSRSPACTRCVCEVDLDVGLGAERARDDRALRVLGGLLLGQLAAAHELVDERVVAREPRQLAVAQQVGAAVADVRERRARRRRGRRR